MRRKAATASQGISLFPFLAVLLCTMGALIVVLVALNRHSRLQAAVLSTAEREAAKAADEEAQAAADLKRETAAWRLDHLRNSREKTQADLDRERLRLGGVEEHRRQLEKQLTALQQTASRLNDLESPAAESKQRNDLAALQAAIDAARLELAEKRQRAANGTAVYSVVPYEGPNRTNRRPIYLECLRDRVVIQPEGIELLAADFDGPPGPGNPLASAVRAARDHLAAMASDPKSTDAEPYPLFLVRPDGIEAYYAARAAMQSWGSDFGYQTVEQDWTLAYPPVDARLAEVERQAVKEARERLEWLAQMSPERFGQDRSGSSGKVTYRVSPLGGLVREGGPALRDAPSGVFDRGEESRRNGIGAGHGRRQMDEPRSSDGSPKPGSGNESAARRGGFSASADPLGDRGVKQSNRGQGAVSQAPDARNAEPRYGDLNERASKRHATESTTPIDVQGSATSDADTGQSEMNVSVTPKSKSKPRSLAETRGANWGLSPAARASNPITRPIHIVCQGDQLLIRPERPDEPPMKLPLGTRTEDSVDPLVTAIQGRIADWGIAGRGLYWRPQLILDVGHSGEGRYVDLEALLADSGFDVKRK